MKEKMMCLNGVYMPEREARVSVFDRGMLWGDGVYDVARTIRHKPFMFREHVARLYRSLRMTRIDPGLDQNEMEAITLGVLDRNRSLLGGNEDVRLVQLVTRGANGRFNLRDTDSTLPTVAVFCAPIDFQAIARQYFTGVCLVTTSTRQRAPQGLEAKLKCTSKLSHMLAELEAMQVGSRHMALLLDVQGYVAECTASSFFIVKDGKLFTSDPSNVLGSITREALLKLAAKVGIPAEERNITVYDVYNADEAMIAGTSFFLLPVREVNGITIGDKLPGLVTRHILRVWSKEIGHDIVGQAMSHLTDVERSRVGDPEFLSSLETTSAR